MPIYEFHCGNCGHTFEKLLLGKEVNEKQICTKCGKEAERVLSGFCNFRTTVNPLRTASQSCVSSRGFS